MLTITQTYTFSVYTYVPHTVSFSTSFQNTLSRKAVCILIGLLLLCASPHFAFSTLKAESKHELAAVITVCDSGL